ncbi:hypothetical protein ACFE04_024457 [Oxalis oulophora]
MTESELKYGVSKERVLTRQATTNIILSFMNPMNVFTLLRFVSLSPQISESKEGVHPRGDDISIVGEIDHDLDEKLHLSRLRAHPLKPDFSSELASSKLAGVPSPLALLLPAS